MTLTPISLLFQIRTSSDGAAWNRFIELFAPLIDRWTRQFGFADNDADDIVQDVFSRLLRVLPTFSYDKSKSFRAWLATVTRNTCRDRLKQQRHTTPITEEHFAAHAELSIDEQTAAAEYRSLLVAQAMRVIERDFAPATWQAFRELVIVGRPAAEVAKKFGMSRNAVYLCRARVLARLREELGDFLLDFEN